MENSRFSPFLIKIADEMDGPADDDNIVDSPTEIDHSTQGVDECGMYGITRCSPTMDVTLERLGICPRQDAAYPSYTTLESRLESFSSWPLSMSPRPEALSDAGFYYTGRGDKTVCYQCGGGLKDWEENDDPWREHAMYFSKCTHLIQKKGREYINQVLGKNNPQVAASSSNEAPQLSDPIPTPSSSRLGVNSADPERSLSDLGSSGYSSGGSFASEETSSSQDNKEKNIETNAVNNQRACKICYAEEVGVVFLPCGHLVACVNCAPSLKTCAVCRKPFSATVRAYLS